MITPEQRFIIDQPLNAKLLVTAGAGTGKTYTLIHRVKKLIEIDRVQAGGEVLVLSFSRSAVREICQRVRGITGDLSYMRARTFDSFATRLLATVQPGGQWSTQGYDERIARAIEAIIQDKDTSEFVRAFRHVIVDEIQDLVGLRAELVKVVLANSQDAGFTLFGDPGQGIYNFHLSGQARRVGSGALYYWLRKTFANVLIEKKLSTNFRATTKPAESALWAGESLASPSPDYKGILQRLTIVKDGLRQVASLTTLAQGLSQAYTGTTAVLCRTNGEALFISNHLRAKRIDHRLQGEATDRIVSPWLAICVAAMPSQVLSKSAFINAYPTVAQQWFSAEDGWRLLRKIDRGSLSVDLAAVSTKLRIGDLPDDILVSRNDKIVVSTIHRAKGLEFDRVFVLYELPPEREDDEEDDAERARLLYVALTRAKRDIFRLAPLKNAFLSLNKYANRWRMPCRTSRFMTRGLEIRGTDSCADLPADYDGPAASALQAYIREHVKRGDAVLLNRIMVRVGEDLHTRYEIVHNDKNVGLVDGSSVYETLRVFPGWRVVMPLAIGEVYVEDIDSVAGLQGAGQRSGLGFADIWLRVRVAGLGTPEYSNQELEQVRRV